MSRAGQLPIIVVLSLWSGCGAPARTAPEIEIPSARAVAPEATAAPPPACAAGMARPGDPCPPAEAVADGDPVVELRGVLEGIQLEVDRLVQPLEDGPSVIEDVLRLPTELASVGRSRLMAEARQAAAGRASDIDGLGLDPAARPAVAGRFAKLRALGESLRTVDATARRANRAIADGVPRVAALGAKAMVTFDATLKNPLASSADKARAQADKAALVERIDRFRVRLSAWQQRLAAVPGQVDALSKRIAADLR
jgi:hypothetical protein